MAKGTIIRWETEKGFGFALSGGKKYFLHVTAIRPRVPKGKDLLGMEVEIKYTSAGKAGQGERITTAELLPLSFTWERSVYDVSKMAVFGQGLWREHAGDYKFLTRGENYSVVDEIKAVNLIADGCPRELIEQIRGYVLADKREYEMAEAMKADSASAEEAALLLEKSLSSGQALVVYPKAIPLERTMNREFANLLTEEWGKRVAALQPAGENTLFAWAIVQQGFVADFFSSFEKGYEKATPEILQLRRPGKGFYLLKIYAFKSVQYNNSYEDGWQFFQD